MPEQVPCFAHTGQPACLPSCPAHASCALPVYAPELNADEGVWHYLKYVELRNVICANRHQLPWYLHRASMHLRSKPQLLLSLFDEAGLSLGRFRYSRARACSRPMPLQF